MLKFEYILSPSNKSNANTVNQFTSIREKTLPVPRSQPKKSAWNLEPPTVDTVPYKNQPADSVYRKIRDIFWEKFLLPQKKTFVLLELIQHNVPPKLLYIEIFSPQKKTLPKTNRWNLKKAPWKRKNIDSNRQFLGSKCYPPWN